MKSEPFAYNPAGKVVLITGAGGGIGAATARRFAAAGAHLVLTDIRLDSLERVQHELSGASVLAFAVDLTQEAIVSDLLRQTMERFGRVDVAVNTAGLLRKTPLEQITKSEWDRVMDVNLGSTFLIAQACLAPMKEQRSGTIVNFASVAGHVGGILAGAHYAAAKAGVICLTKSLAKLLAPYGVTVNTVSPSAVDTEMVQEFTEEQREVLRAGIPLGRLGNTAEMAEMVYWLSSPAASFITGQTLNINGGAYMA